MFVVFGGFMILVGFLSLIRFRFVIVRRRLSPAASIRSRAGSGSLGGRSSDASMGRSVSVLLMLGGGLVVLAGVLTL